MSRRAPNKRMYVRRLQAWIAEKETNRYGMRELADRAIKLLRADIERYWPGTDTERYMR